MRLQPTAWMLAVLLGLSACDGTGGAPPEALDSLEARRRGRELFLGHCAICHGARADGRGVRSRSLSSPPADFSDPSWPGRTSPRRTFEIIRSGVPGTSMPAWKVLDEDETWALVAYLHSVATRGAEVRP